MIYTQDTGAPLTKEQWDYNFQQLALRLGEPTAVVLRSDRASPLTNRDVNRNFQNLLDLVDGDASIVLRGASPLEAYQVDGNFASLDAAVNRKLYGAGPYPVMDTVFAGARYLDPRITFSRPDDSYRFVDGVLQSWGPNEPVLLPDGLSLRPPETNLLWAWEGTDMVNARININTTLDNGAVLFVRTRDDINCYSGNTRVGNFANKRVTATLDIEVRPDSDNTGFRFQATYPARIDIIFRADTRTASVTTNSIPSSNPEITIEPLAGDTYRVSLTATVTQPSGGTAFYFGPTKKTTEVSWESDLSVSRCYIRRAQFNEGGPIPPIPTSTSAVTRAADSAVIQGQDFADMLNPSEGAIILGSTLTAISDFCRYFAFAGSASQVSILLTLTGQMYMYCVVEGAGTTYTIDQAINYSGRRTKIGLRWAAGVISVWVDGVVRRSAVNAGVDFTLLDRLWIGRLDPYKGALLGVDFAVFQQAPTDTQMQEWTS